jgi:hypothetical protein
MPQSTGFIAPYPLALILCDSVYVEPPTQRKALTGLFSAIQAVSFPVCHPSLCVYLACTDGRGNIPFKLVLIDAEEARDPIFTAEMTPNEPVDDPRAILELVFKVSNVIFPEPGEYRLQAYAGNDLLLERRVVVQQVQQPQQGENS